MMTQPTLLGQMINQPLLISSFLAHAERHHGNVEIVSRRVEGDIHRTTYAEVAKRARKLANALKSLNIRQGDRIATLAWNGYRHMEIYYAVAGSGAVCHTVNPRLFPQQITYIINHAEDSLVFFDTSFLPMIEKVADLCKGVKAWICMTDRAHMPKSKVELLCYEEILEAQSDNFTWPVFDENLAASLCYTSGTTGNPKGCLYSHRSTTLHTYMTIQPDAFCLSARDIVMPVVPMFHVNAWGLPFSTAMVGCKLVFPGEKLDGASLHQLFEEEKVNFSAGVPTVWMGLLQYMKKNGLRFSTFRRTMVGGSAVPPAMIAELENDYDVEVIHGWGMTELSPLGTVTKRKGKHAELSQSEWQKILVKQGRAPYGIDMKIVDGDGRDLPWDGKAFGELKVRGHWVINRYFKADHDAVDEDGWLATGDVSTIDPDGFMQITDRSKDVIKSGGEWISSVELENIAMSHPKVFEAACIGCRHPKWDERPLLVVVPRPGEEITKEELLKFYDGKIARWWTPDDVVFLPEIPHTATGKMLKLKLREQFKDYKFPGV
jgi:fatty-acyl-CoA synthase